MQEFVSLPFAVQGKRMNAETDDFTFEVCTSSDITGMCYFATMREALQTAEKNPTVWKVSFVLPNGELIRFIRVEPTFWDKVFFWCEKETEWLYSPF
jgi:hypothetical protein